MTAECSLEFTNTVADQVLVPIPRDIQNIGGISRGRERLRSIESDHKEFKLAPYGNRFILIDVLPDISRGVNFKVPEYPSPPPTDKAFLDQCLSNGERYTKWLIDKPLISLIDDREKLGTKMADKDLAKSAGTFIKERFHYSRDRFQYDYINDLLYKGRAKYTSFQDCLGYHGVFVGFMRSLGIPAVLDIGFRLSEEDHPHAWAWYFDRQGKRWAGIDLNDYPDYIAFSFKGKPRVSMTLGTTHSVNIEGFGNTTASFIQYGLSKSRLENRTPFTKASFRVLKPTDK